MLTPTRSSKFKLLRMHSALQNELGTQLPVRGVLVDLHLHQWLPIPSTMGERARVVMGAGILEMDKKDTSTHYHLCPFTHSAWDG